MNDELTGQLVNRTWDIPRYAQSALWLVTDTESVQVEGSRGLFELTTPASKLHLRYGTADGPVLAVLPWQADTLEWNGTVKLGGYVDAVQLAELPRSEVTVSVLYLSGRPLKSGASTYPHARRRHDGNYDRLDFQQSINNKIDETTTTWLISDDSPLITLAQDSMLQGLPVWFSGRLADEGSHWEDHFALPLILESLLLFAN